MKHKMRYLSIGLLTLILVVLGAVLIINRRTSVNVTDVGYPASAKLKPCTEYKDLISAVSYTKENGAIAYHSYINLPSADNNEAALNKWIAQHPNGVGGGWCAELVQSVADSFGNSQGRPLGLAGGGRWRAGPQASGNADFDRGTVLISGIKEWGKSGVFYYPNYQDLGNHAAL
jgi:hypothetical protein